MAVIRAHYAFTDGRFEVTGICSTNTTCGPTDQAVQRRITTAIVIAYTIRLQARARNRAMELLVTTAQLLNCITATGNLDVTSAHCLASRGYFQRGFCRPAGHRRVPCFRFSKRSVASSSRSGHGFPVSVLIPSTLLDYVSGKEVRIARTIDHPCVRRRKMLDDV